MLIMVSPWCHGLAHHPGSSSTACCRGVCLCLKRTSAGPRRSSRQPAQLPQALPAGLPERHGLNINHGAAVMGALTCQVNLEN